MSLLFDKVMVQLSRCDCARCGLTFGISDQFEQKRRNDHATFYCPNGHTNYYPAKSDAELAREEADRLRRHSAYLDTRVASLRTDLESERHKVAAERGAKTKLKKKLGRIAQGVCPCCNRTFQNVKRHMATKHPQFAEQGS